MGERKPEEEQGQRETLFPDTSLTLMQALQAGDDPIAAQALNQFAEIYFAPLLRYVRGRGFSPEDAEDLVQDYFHRVIIEKRAVHTLETKGSWRLRTFLRVSLHAHVVDHLRRTTAQKRGGHLDRTMFDEGRSRGGPAQEQAVLDFEREWAQAILDRAYTRLRNTYRRPGREALYDTLEGRLSARAELHGLAEKLGLSDGALRATLARMRKSFRHALSAEVRQTVNSDDEVSDEIRHLLRILETPSAAG